MRFLGTNWMTVPGNMLGCLILSDQAPHGHGALTGHSEGSTGSVAQHIERMAEAMSAGHAGVQPEYFNGLPHTTLPVIASWSTPSLLHGRTRSRTCWSSAAASSGRIRSREKVEREWIAPM
jgi:hypothetical protein